MVGRKVGMWESFSSLYATKTICLLFEWELKLLSKILMEAKLAVLFSKQEYEANSRTML